MGGLTLVTGGTGFAGGHLIEHLLGSGEDVAAWSNPRGQRMPDDARVRWQAVDLLDREGMAAALAELTPAVIYHCGGIADVGASWAHGERALRVNALGTHYLLEAARMAGLECTVLITSSALVYRPSDEAIGEDSPAAPSSPYGFSKLAQELIASRARAGRVYIARAFNHAGPRQSSAYVTSSFARQIAEIEAGQREPVLHVGNLESRRDITDVRDTVAAYRRIVGHGRPGRPYNVCTGRAYRVADLLETLIGLSRIPVAVRPDPSRLRPADVPVVLGDPTRIREETGWHPAIPIERTLADLLEHWRGHTLPA